MHCGSKPPKWSESSLRRIKDKGVEVLIQKYKNFTPEIDETCYIAPGSAVIGKVKIGRNSSVWHNAVIRGDIERIAVGEYSNIQDGSLLHCVHNVELTIGDYVTVGHGAILHSCKIGDNCLVGMGAIVLDNVKVGDNSLIGAGAVVTPNTEIPEGSLVLGSPAKVKRPLTPEEISGIKSNAGEYVRLSEDYMNSAG